MSDGEHLDPVEPNLTDLNIVAPTYQTLKSAHNYGILATEVIKELFAEMIRDGNPKPKFVTIWESDFFTRVERDLTYEKYREQQLKSIAEVKTPTREYIAYLLEKPFHQGNVILRERNKFEGSMADICVHAANDGYVRISDIYYTLCRNSNGILEFVEVFVFRGYENGMPVIEFDYI